MLRELRGDTNGAKRTRNHATWLDPESYPPLPILSNDAVQEILKFAIKEFNPTLKDYFSHLPLYIEEVPSLQFLEQFGTPPSPIRLLCFLNTQNKNKSSSIIMFRQNLRRALQDEERMLLEIRNSLLVYNTNPFSSSTPQA